MLNMEPDLAGKITGMLLEMSEGDVIAIIEDHVACQDKVCCICSPVAVATSHTSEAPACLLTHR